MANEFKIENGLIVSGNISASGAISSSTIRAVTSVTSPIGNFTSITASNISASGYVSASTINISPTKFSITSGSGVPGGDSDSLLIIHSGPGGTYPALYISQSGVNLAKVVINSITPAIYPPNGTAELTVNGEIASTTAIFSSASIAKFGYFNTIEPLSSTFHGLSTLNITASNISASGDITMSGILVTGNSRIPIGAPSDTVFTDGFFDTFTNQTKLADAIDEISEAFLDLAPPKAGVLTGTTLSSSGTNLYSAFLAGGLNPHWYSGSSQSGSLITTFINQPFLKLSTTQSSQPTASFFRSGKYSDFTVLTGGVTSSFSTGSNPVVVASSASILKSTGSIVSSSLAIGTGLLPSTFINGTNRYNTFWAQTSASISHSLTITGSLNYALGADNSAGITNTSTYWFASSLTDYPNQNFPGVTCSIATPNLKYMSGMTYLSGSSTVKVSLTASNLHDPVYNTTPISFAFSNPIIGTPPATGSSVTPNFDTIINLDTSVINSSANLASSYGTLPTLIITATKPGKSNVSSAATTVYPRPVNNYGSPASVTTNDANTITEHFYDEYYRLGNLKSGSASTYVTNFPSASNLQTVVSNTVSSHLQVQNGRLISGGATGADYSGFTSGSSGGGYANYFRRLDLSSNNIENGHLSMSFNGFNTISPWGTSTGTGPEVALVLSSSISSDLTASSMFDLGLGTGLYNGNITGAQNATLSLTSSGKVYWSLIGASTGLATSTHMVLWIRYKNAVNSYIDDFTFKTI